ncbi:fumarylacetoacetate hydrolase family protein [Arthrobacter sp. NA-172]|uniref:fumarylacetoacetate hydrolase family protein n=1 Tax=Arthrobacter sp. NA-172 TaxID=3367524 RepID=UPI0037553DF3
MVCGDATKMTAPVTRQFEFELEVAAVIGRSGTTFMVSGAERYIAEYTILCDGARATSRNRRCVSAPGPRRRRTQPRR